MRDEKGEEDPPSQFRHLGLSRNSSPLNANARDALSQNKWLKDDCIDLSDSARVQTGAGWVTKKRNALGENSGAPHHITEVGDMEVGDSASLPLIPGREEEYIEDYVDEDLEEEWAEPSHSQREAADAEESVDGRDEEMLCMGIWEAILVGGYLWTRAWVVLAGLPSDGVKTWNAADVSGEKRQRRHVASSVSHFSAQRIPAARRRFVKALSLRPRSWVAGRGDGAGTLRVAIQPTALVALGRLPGDPAGLRGDRRGERPLRTLNLSALSVDRPSFFVVVGG